MPHAAPPCSRNLTGKRSRTIDHSSGEFCDVLFAQLFNCNLLHHTLDVLPCPFSMNYKPHAPCSSPPRQKSKRENLSWMMNQSRCELCDFFAQIFIVSWHPWSSMFYQSPPQWITNLMPHAAPLCDGNLSGKKKQDNWPLQWWVYDVLFAQLFNRNSIPLTLDVLPHPFSINYKPQWLSMTYYLPTCLSH